MHQDTDFPLSEVPNNHRKGMLSMAVILLGFTFYTATMWAGGSIGTAFSFDQLLLIIVVGNLILGIYAAALGWIAYKTGLNTVLLGRYCFGEKGSRLADFVLGFTQIGWYAWGVATIAIVLTTLLNLDKSWQLPLMILFGFGFCISAFIGYRAIDILSKISVPLMLIFIAISFYRGLVDVGGLVALFGIEPTSGMTMSAAVTVVIGTFISGATQATNWSRFAKSGRVAVIATLIAFFLGNGLMVFIGAYGALIYQHADIVDVLVAQGFLFLAIAMLFTNLWTTQDNTIYNFAAAGCNLLRSDKRRTITLVGAAIGTVLAVLGMYNYLIPFLVLLGTFIPPIGAVIMTSYWFVYRGELPKLASVTLPNYHWVGLAAYVIGSTCAYLSPWMPPLVGIIATSVSYIVLAQVFALRTKATQVGVM
ncbi:cytosine permease [Vibrio porteresiae]|uniref:Cytosine permease n=1 Tax=Vibrio porteresiae DSM 19223 TaxID=1123496 RepID=A0ABZ0Q7S4_9VIBR|nr:cytosine permease [Vibrio porteresiae]WPC72454.1 cytosine permease [Vibrio porteresiae DSM 19223]